MAENKNILIGKNVGGIPTHSDYASGDVIIPPPGATTNDVPYAEKSHGHTVSNSICSFFPGRPTSSQVVMAFPVTTAMTIPAGATNSIVKSGTAATGTPVFNLYKNSTPIGSFQFSGTIATFTVASATDYAVGDLFKIVAPASADSTLADLYIAIVVSGTI